MKSYCLGFLLTDDLKTVILIQKNRPDFQKGKLNGIGGSIEKGETPLQAMIRECKEETNIEVDNFVNFADLITKDYKVHIFYAVNSYQTYTSQHRQMTDEKFRYFSTIYDGVFSIPDWFMGYSHMANLEYFIPMALNHYLKIDKCKKFEIKEL